MSDFDPPHSNMVRAPSILSEYGVVQSVSLVPPVLFIGFNRPETTRETFARLAEVRPKKLYVALDAPREGNQRDIERCREVRDLIKPTWNCDLQILEREHNLGCREGVCSALDWFFEHEEMGIILEDDCVPNDSFWRFCGENLERYKDDERIASIAGSNYELGQVSHDSSYYFSRYVYVWGWATWRRVWQQVDREMSDWPRLRDAGWLGDLLGAPARERFWVQNFDRAHSKSVDIWSYLMLYTCWTHGMMNIVPSKNLVSNIGFGPDAVHTVRSTRYDRLATEELEFPLVHPTLQMIDETADRLVGEQMFSRYGLPRRIYNRAHSELETIFRRLKHENNVTFH